MRYEPLKTERASRFATRVTTGAALALAAAFAFAPAAFGKDAAGELSGKGLDATIYDKLTPACVDALNHDFEREHGFWNGLWRDQGVTVVDFFKKSKHYSIAMNPMPDGSCQTVRNITSYWNEQCSTLAETYKKGLPPAELKVRQVENIFTWISNGKGTDVYLYKTPTGCMELFKEYYVRAPGANGPAAKATGKEAGGNRP